MSIRVVGSQQTATPARDSLFEGNHHAVVVRDSCLVVLRPRLLPRRVHPSRRQHGYRAIKSRISARCEIRRPKRRNGDRRWDPGDVEACTALGEKELVRKTKGPPVRQVTLPDVREYPHRVLSDSFDCRTAAHEPLRECLNGAYAVAACELDHRPMPSGPCAWHHRAWLGSGHERRVIWIATRNLRISRVWRRRQPAGDRQAKWIDTTTAEPHVNDEPSPSGGGREDRIERGVQRTPIGRVVSVRNVAPERCQSQIADGVAEHAERHLVVAP